MIVTKSERRKGTQKQHLVDLDHFFTPTGFRENSPENQHETWNVHLFEKEKSSSKPSSWGSMLVFRGEFFPASHWFLQGCCFFLSPRQKQKNVQLYQIFGIRIFKSSVGKNEATMFSWINPLEHTPAPQPPIYKENSFMFVFWGTWNMLQRSVGNHLP